MDKLFYTYIHCKPDGYPFYVGKGRGNRAYELYDTRRNKHHINIVNKYGKENIGIFIFYCDSENEAFSDEIQQILQLQNEGFKLCNMTEGGEGRSGSDVSEETKKILSEKSKGQTHNRGRKHSLEYCMQVSKRQIGRKLSQETKAKMSESHKKRISENPELKEKRRLDMIDAWANPIQRAKRIASMKAAKK